MNGTRDNPADEETRATNRVVFFEENVLSEKTNENLVGSVEHPISKVCSLFAVVKNAVGLAPIVAVWICRDLVFG